MLKVVPAPAPSLRFEGDDAALVEAFRRGEPAARREFHQRHAAHVRRVLTRLLGGHDEISDLHQDVFVRALRSHQKLKKPEALKPWLTAIAVYVARSAITRKRRRRWLMLMPPEEVPQLQAVDAPWEAREALKAMYALLDELPVDDRIAFALRFIDGMELIDVAQACGTSLATIKRRLTRAKKRFEARAASYPIIQDWLEEGSRWTPQKRG